MIDVDRAQVMAFRVAALGLAERSDAHPADLPVLDLGVQDSTPDSTRIALTARTTAEPGRTTAEPGDDRLIIVWGARGAPHLHRRADLPSLVEQLWPVSDDDAAARIKSGQIPDGARLGLRAFTATAEAFRAVVTGPMPRGQASTEVSRRVPAELTYDCKSCGARHIAGNVWQHAGLAGGVEVLARGKDASLGPIPDPPPLPSANRGVDRLIETYLRLLGPAGPAEVAKYLGSTTAVIKGVWPSGLAEVRVDGRRAWLPQPEAARLESVPAPHGARWLPAMDPLLQARDRDLLVPGRERQKEVWRILGNPGVLLLDGEIAGVWRARMSGRKRVDLTVTPFERLSKAQTSLAEEEAGQVARARGVPEARVIFE
ncbi:crosslink repair DNA glycosylase YcaQ family protein [Actinoplanes sp. NEAU-A12]|uniref:Crosslink repair DNA glycosylase YcaQ family protein n=1 Tax=Actinoplanes sandaracinus TaxID=3045177 RepID=A0ABT6WG18_9ACTN|nr:crosslink repair DNA glycosylase YcaQ family protein [Actinoplanes sandaracinus]MDI6098669.1 crosslink repair DNA glycosylase YcaQ family protein [Actinoplanes sandaracinus]